MSRKRRELNKLWELLFPLQVGDRVKIRTQIDNLWYKEEYAEGEIGTIKKINPTLNHPYVIEFDDQEKTQFKWHVYKKAELERIGKRKVRSTTRVS